jgi:hypothetical protein
MLVTGITNGTNYQGKMMKTRDKVFFEKGNAAGRQRGVLTTFTAVMVLVLLTLMMVFAVRAGVFEQRDSANDYRQKLAFHAAESGIEQAKEFIRSNAVLVGSRKLSLLPDGTDGWLASGAEKWIQCNDETLGLDLVDGHGDHPCFGEPVSGRRENMYFFFDNDSTELPIDTTGLFPAGSTEEVTVEALLCVIPEGFSDSVTTIDPCSLDPDVAEGSQWMITFLARGEADCSNGICNAQAMIAERATHAGAFAGGRGPDVPLVTRSSFPPSGTAEIVPNPDAGGQGVPLSLWVNDNDSCEGGTPVDPSSGSWATCQYHEWYAQDSMPDDVACAVSTCGCTEAESISYSHGTDDVFGFDLVQDPDFPCDLFEYFFGVPDTEFEVIKSQATVISDCTTLNENSFGIYWATGAECGINDGVTIGSPDAPVLLISASAVTRVNSGAELFGILYIADVEVPNAYLRANGNFTTYGTVIVDAAIDALNGTFQVVYNEDIIGEAVGGGTLAGLAGGWTDFHKDWE